MYTICTYKLHLVCNELGCCYISVWNKRLLMVVTKMLSKDLLGGIYLVKGSITDIYALLFNY